MLYRRVKVVNNEELVYCALYIGVYNKNMFYL